MRHGAGANKDFAGFNDAFKNQMASLLGKVTNAQTPDTTMLKNKLVIGLISIDNTLKLIHKDKNRERELKPVLQYLVKNFMSDLDMVQGQLARLNGSKVIGNKNSAAGKAVIQGNNNKVKGSKSMTLGNNNSVQGNRAIVAGNNNAVKGSKGVTVGSNNQVKANNSFVFANNDKVSKDNTLTVRNSTIDLNKLATNGKGGYLTTN